MTKDRIVFRKIGDSWLLNQDFLPKTLNCSITKLLGGKDNVIRDRWFRDKIHGGYITDYYVLDKNKETINKLLEDKYNVYWLDEGVDFSSYYSVLHHIEKLEEL